MRHRCVKDSWCYCSHSNTKLAKVSCHRHYHAVDCTLGRTVCNLASLTFRCRDTGYEDNHTLFTSIIYSFVF
jgi:hypothetical protein